VGRIGRIHVKRSLILNISFEEKFCGEKIDIEEM
jgi:hypothetical protein